MSALDNIASPEFRAECERSHSYWLGVLGYAAASTYAAMPPSWERNQLGQALEDYLSSSACSQETRTHLRGVMEG